MPASFFTIASASEASFKAATWIANPAPAGSTADGVAGTAAFAGSGFGTFVPILQAYERPADILVFFINHAHNDWLELTLEGGILAVLLLAAWLLGEPGITRLSAPVVLAFAYQCVVVAFISYLGWFWLLRGFVLFRMNPAMWALLIFAYWMLVAFVNQIPVAGPIVATLVLPAPDGAEMT